jgi:integrase
MKGIKKADVNLANQTIWIGGSWSTAENRYVKRTKKQDSTRFVEIQNDYLPYIIEWMDKIKDLDNPYLFPSLKTKEPMSDAAFRGMIWMTYEEYGLATLEWRIKDYNNINGKRNTGSRGISKSFKIIDSPFKDAPTKTFRHSLATHLVNAVKAKGSLIDQNYVMNVLGHGDFQTTQNIYGNHVLEISEDERAARRIAVQKAMRIGKS